MIELRLYDRQRVPNSWTEILQPGQFVVFAKTCDTGAPCDANGRVFADVEAATCLVFDRLAEAAAFCNQQVMRTPAVRLEVFDGAGRAHAPLLVVVHPSKASALESNPNGMRRRQQAAIALFVIAAGSFWYDFRGRQGIDYFPTLLGINLVVVAARLLQLNASYAHAERERQQRLADHGEAKSTVGPSGLS